ncbi:sigma-E processing peptidase SpoIIGA [Marvinbryantia formatexigens]|uniref:sigma-E processing peptidase SpoIIGA n=1 Tax=Marvinbryantia formatexigens TaxID=168384 RepID=UPI0002E83497|nr:sigma-E processing peptidase SpoIIGA [Marvinbryantia formatexigens]UWO25831.1 sigma-E processing peptidase SpoIIGA [Marvinbryantia formatexigens DSM 14469]SDF39107.1 Sporulation factor SpoIIGA [Marvinbryantia formatexigens]
MYYEIYLDVYFLENLMLYFLILQFAEFIQKDTFSMARKLLASGIGAFGACMLVVFPIHKSRILSVVCSILLCFLTAYTAGKKRGSRSWRKMVFSFCILSLFLGGIWQFFIAYLKLPFWIAAMAGYAAARLLWKYWQKAKAGTGYLYDVTLKRGTAQISLKGLLDSGNQLTEPLTDRPVHIVDYDEICRLLSDVEILELDSFLDMEIGGSMRGGFVYVPYHSVGESRGVLPAMTLDSMEIRHGESAWSTKRVLVAVSRKAVSSRGKYQMILHPRILE